MKVCLINPPHPYLVKPDSQAPLGLLYLAAVLRDAGHEVVLSNLSRYSVDEALYYVPWDAKLYGFTATCVDYNQCEELARGLLRHNIDASYVIGGPHPTVAPQLVDFKVFDSLCQGEGEEVILQMVNDTETQGFPDQQYTGRRIDDLDSIPFPAREMMDVVGGDIFAEGEHHNGSEDHRSTVIIGSRGCPWNCSFCASKATWGKAVRIRSPKSIVDEVKHVIETYGVREFRFSDDTFNLKRKRMLQLCEMLEPLGIFWRCSARAGLSSKSDFAAMYAAGCREIACGIESGDQRILDHLEKRASVHQNRQMINWATEAGLNVRILLMIGTPGEHEDTPEINRDFLSSVDYRVVTLTQFRPIPGSPIWICPRKYGCRILDRDVASYNFYSWIRGPDGQPMESPIESVIETDLLTKDQLESNIRRMRRYLEETGRFNNG